MINRETIDRASPYKSTEKAMLLTVKKIHESHKKQIKEGDRYPYGKNNNS
jgi:hypothetical protein